LVTGWVARKLDGANRKPLFSTPRSANKPMTHIELILGPDGMPNNFRRKPVAFVWACWSVHPFIVALRDLICQYWRSVICADAGSGR
jgi:hypothetical protein